MSYKVKFTDTAIYDLNNIVYYIFQESHDIKIAINFVEELKNKTKILELFPESGSIPNDRTLKAQNFRFIIHKEYCIFYHFIFQENTSYILSIFNAKRDYSKVMLNFINNWNFKNI